MKEATNMAPEWMVTPRLKRVTLGGDGTKVAEYETFGEACERIASAAVIAANARCPEEATRLARAAAQLAEFMVTPPAFVDLKAVRPCVECDGVGCEICEAR